MPVTVAQNPFIGPRPISKDEPIFGRDEEINRLTHLLLAERIVLLYSPSGAGKSSLIHAGLLRSLTEETEDDFYLPPTIGLSITASSAAPGPSLFSEAVIRSLERAGPANGSTGKIDSVEEYLRSHLKKSANGRCICLVFDQFEECVTFLPGQEAAKSAFFLDLARTLADPNVWALFAVREDFLAPIIDLGRVLPTRFKQAFRLDFLSKSRAQEVIQKTAHLGRYEFAAAALEQLVNDLAIVNVQGVDGTFSAIPGEYVEPLHLQVACRHIIQRLPEGTAKIEKWHLECPANGGPRPESSVDDALAAYYENELSKITENNKARERDLRFWIEENLFDASGIRIPIRQSVRLTQGLDNETIEKLYDSYLVRKERRLNATWYELAHDRLVQPIRLNNKEWFDQNLGLLGKSFREWTRRSRDSRYLLNARDLKRALKENQANFGSLAADEKTFVNESKKRIRARRLVVMIPFALAALCAAAAFYFKQQREFLAYYNNRLAYYSSFAVLRPLYSGWTPGSLDRNVLFACHLVKEVSHWETPADPLFYGDVVTILDRALARRGRLQATYWNYERPASSTEVGDRIPVGAVAYSPDGKTLALGDARARVRILRDKVLSPPIPVGGRKVWTLAFSPDGNRVAIGTQTGFISLLDLLDPSPALTAMQLQFPGPSSELHDVWSCSWSEKGDLAAACQDGKVYIWQDLLRALESRTPPAVVILQNRGKTATIPVHAVAWDHSSGVLAMGDGAGNLRTWDGRTLSEPVRAAANAIWSLAWSLDGRLACGSWDRSISIWKNDNSVPGATLSRLVSNPLAHDQWVRDVTWIDNGAIASVGDDGMLKLWNSSDLALLGSEQSPTTELWRLAYSPSANTIATANDDGAVRLYLRALPRPDTHGDHLNTVACLGFVNSTILSFDSDGVVDIFDPSSRKEEKVQLPVDLQSNIRTVRFHPKIGAFVVGYNLAFLHQSVKGRIAVWYPQPPIRVKRMDFAEPIASVSCHPTEPIVAFVTPAGILGLRTVPDLQPLPSQSDFPINLKSDSLLVAKIGWSNRGDVLLLALNRENKNTSEIVRFHFDGKSLSPVNRGNPVEVPALIGSFDWHPSDQLVAIGTRGGATILHDFTAGQTGPVVGHDGPVNVVAWSADGLQLFTGGDDRIIKVWAYHSAAKDKLTSVTTLHHDKGGVHAMAVCPDGKGIYTAGTDPGVFYWPATSYSVDAIVARAHQMVNRNMTRGEWLRYAQSEESRQQKYEKTFEDLPDLSSTESQ